MGGRPRIRDTAGQADRKSHAAPVAVATLAGWAICDLGIFLEGGEPALVLRTLGPAYLGMGGIAVLLGLMVERWRLTLPILVLLLVAVVLAGSWVKPPPSITGRILPRALLILVGAFAIARALPVQRWIGQAPIAAVLGMSGCLAMIAHRGEVPPFLTNFIQLPALLLLLLPLLRRRALRDALVWCALMLVCTLLGVEAMRRSAPPRARALAKPAIARGSGAQSDYLRREPAGVSANVVLITIDTLRPDHLGIYGCERDTSPRLDRFAREHATLYTEARATSPFTLPSHGSLFTGLFPAEHGAKVGAHASRPLARRLVTLAERLLGQGYQTAAVFSNLTYLNARLGFARGFEVFDMRPFPYAMGHLALPQLLGLQQDFGHTYRRGDAISNRAIEWLEERRRPGPFFLALNYLDVHSPYLPPPAYSELFSEEQPADPYSPGLAIRRLLYDRCVRFVDDQVARVLDKLMELGLFENSLIVITSDHGEAFGQHGIPEHCWSLYEELVRVPLLVKPAGGRSAERDELPISGAAVHDLILDQLGLEPAHPPERPEGLVAEWYPWPLLPANRSLAERIGMNFEAKRIAWLRGSRKTIVSHAGTVEVFDLDTDPREESALEIGENEKAAALKEAGRWWFRHRRKVAVPPIPPEELKALEALGYGG